MEIDELINKIRKEEVALVIGSGMSLYAGYPGVKDLLKIIRLNAERYCLDEWEKQNLAEEGLDSISGILIRYCNGDRSELNKILIENYKKPPIDTHTHDLLARIPHFEHIFTTNYDTLIEDSMAKRCHVIGSESQFTSQAKGFTKIYKLHGDVNNLDEIIISKKDYANNINGQQKKLIWNRFADIIASKDILFIGHSHEDINFWGMFDELNEKLKGHQRKRFLISPSIASHQRQHLLVNGFNYLNMNADQFLNDLYPKLVEHAVADLECDNLSSDTFQRFLTLNERNAIIRSEDSKIRVEAIIAPSGLVESEVNFSLTKDIYKDFMNFNKGKSRTRSYKFQTDDLVDFTFSMSGYKLAISKETIRSFEVMLVHEIRSLDIESENGTFEVTKIPVRQYNFKDGCEMELEFYGSKFLFAFHFLKGLVHVKFTYNLAKDFSSLNELIATLEFMHELYDGKTLNFYFDGKTKIPIANTKPSALIFKSWPLNGLIEHFKQLRQISKILGVRFTAIAFNQITQTNIDEVHHISQIITNGFVEQIFRKVIFLPQKPKQYGPPIDSEDDAMTLICEKPHVYKFYGTSLPKLYLVFEVLDSEVIQAGKNYGVKSRSEKIRHKIIFEQEFIAYQKQNNRVVTTKMLRPSA